MSFVTSTLPAIIAAAGRSSRMGSTKALLQVRGESFLARMLGTFKKGGIDSIMVVVRELDGDLASEAASLGGKVVLNADPSSGPISSLQAGIRALPPDVPGVFFTPVDFPLVLPSTIHTLAGEFLKATPPLAAPSFRGKPGHPVIFGQPLFSELLAHDLPLGARTVVRRHADQRLLVPVEDPGILIDIDTPEEFRRHFPSD